MTSLNLLTLKYRARYWRRRVLQFLGICPACYTRLNITRAGAAVCPACKAR